MIKTAILLCSGGQDSATCLAWAQAKFDHIYALGFDYGQRHHLEISKARDLCQLAKVDYICLNANIFKTLSSNALIDENRAIEWKEQSLPNTFVPGRNLLFLSLAAAWGYEKNCVDLITGVCQSDYSGYPDCRQNFISAAEKSISLALDRKIHIHTPLMHLSKAESVLLMKDLGKIAWYQHTHSCYQGVHPPCGHCPACLLRQKGFKEAGLKDPLLSS